MPVGFLMLFRSEKITLLLMSAVHRDVVQPGQPSAEGLYQNFHEDRGVNQDCHPL